MGIKIGDKLPGFTFTVVTESDPVKQSVDEIFMGKNVVVVGIPGAFTPVCTGTHIPGYINNMESLNNKGIDEIVVLSVNDVFVMKAWAESMNALGKITFIADHDAEFVKKIGLYVDLSDLELGIRSSRWSMLVKDSVVKVLNVESVLTKDGLTGASCMIKDVIGELRELK